VILTAYISGQSLEVRRQWEDISKNEEVKTASQKFSLWQTTLQIKEEIKTVPDK
jgi:hypothetical protein